MYACMGTTTISLKDEAYRRLEQAKHEGESFSDVVMRLTGDSRTEAELDELAGGLGAELADAVEASAEEVGDDLEPDPAT